MKMRFSQLFSLVAIPSVADAICPGYNFAIGNEQNFGSSIHCWAVYGDSCNTVDGLSSEGNPCDSGKFTGSPSPVLFDSYTAPDGLKYYCGQDPNSGSCGGDVISVCCRNDGR